MYIESVINDYYERNDFDVSSFNFLASMAQDYQYQELMSEINKENDELSNSTL